MSSTPNPLRIYWTPPGDADPLHIPAVDLACAKLMIRALLLCDASCDHRAAWRGGLEVLKDGSWSEWHNADGNDIRWIMVDGEAG